MSGIAVLFDRRGNELGADRLEKMSFALLPYGRKRRDVHTEHGVGFIHTGFVNTPEAVSDRQPAVGADGNLFLLFDGRLDNRDDLTAALGLAPEAARQASDTRLALLSWERWGPAAALRWVGEFAALAWNAQAGTLTALVDPFGQRQLLYATSPDLAVVASTARAIFASGTVEMSLDRQAMADHLGRVLPEPGSSFYVGVRRVPAGHVATLSAGGAEIGRYYDPAPGEPIRLARDEEYVEAAQELLDRVVGAHTRSTGRVGTDLSGGLDSALVAAGAVRLAPGSAPIPAFTIQPGEGDTLDRPSGMVAEESGLVADMLAHLPRLHAVPLTNRERQWDRIAELTFDLGEMPAASAHFEETYARKMETAREHGMTTLLTGQPGNLTLSWDGRGLFREHFRSLSWIRLARELYRDRDRSRRLPRRIFDYLLRPAVPRPLVALARRARDRALLEPPWRRCSVIAPAFAAEYDVAARAAASLAPYDARPDLLTPADRAAVIDQFGHTHAAAGQQMARAAFGIEIRSPLWDQRIVEWSLRVPETQFRRNGIDRWLARRLAARSLPASVAWNRRRGFLDSSWHSRIAAELPRLREQVKTLAEDSETAAMIDTARLEAILANWDAYQPDRIAPHQRYLLIAGLQNTIHAGRFVRWVRGANR